MDRYDSANERDRRTHESDRSAHQTNRPTQERVWASNGAQESATDPVINVEQFVHDLDNLLMVIANRADLAQADLASDRKCAESIRAIQIATQRALRLSELLRRAESDAEVPLDKVNLAHVIQATVDSAKAWTPKNVAIVEDLPVDTSPIVLGNFTQLGRVVGNLLSNAIDSLRPGGHVCVSLELTDKCAARPHSASPNADGPFDKGRRDQRQQSLRRMAVLRVCDNGVGMDATVLNRIFEPGFSQKRRGTGNGLGMTIVADIVRDHGGDLAIDSTPGEGTEVSIRLPIAGFDERNAGHV